MARHRLRKRPFCGALAVLLQVHGAHAEPTVADLDRGRESYRAALALETSDDWAGALGKLREVASVKLTPQVRFHIARCQEKLGRWTEAVGGYRQAIAEAQASKLEDVVREATQALVALEPSVPRLRIVRATAAAGAMIALDGVPLGETSIGVELAIDPGPHRLEMKLGARETTTIATLSPREQRTVTLDLPDKDRVPAESSSAGIPARRDKGESSSAPPTASPPRRSRASAFVMLGVGAAGIAATGVFWALRAGTIHDLDAHCVDGRCPPSLASTADRGQLFTVGAAGGLAIAATGLAGFAWLWFRKPDAVTSGMLRLAPTGAGIGGTF